MKNGFLKVFINECQSLATSPKRIFYVLVFPLLVFGFLSAIFYTGVPRDLPVAYLDFDQTQTSSKLVQFLDATPSIEMAKSVNSQEEAQRLMQEGKIYAFVVIPENFNKKVTQSLNTEVVCYINGQFLMPAGLIQKDFLRTVGTFSAGVNVKKATQNRTQTQKALASVQPVLTDVHILYNPYGNYAFYLLVVLLPTVLQMVVMMITVYVIGVEFKYQSTEKWFAMSGESGVSALFGKMLPYTLCLFFVGWWMNYFLFVRLGVPLKVGFINVVLMSFLLIVIYQLIAVSIVSVMKDFRGALTIGSGFTAIALSFAAYTFPMEGLPKSMQYLAQVFPFTHFVEYFINRAIKGIPIEMTWQPMASMLIFVLLFVLTFPKFMKRLKSGGYD